MRQSEYRTKWMYTVTVAVTPFGVAVSDAAQRALLLSTLYQHTALSIIQRNTELNCPGNLIVISVTTRCIITFTKSVLVLADIGFRRK